MARADDAAQAELASVLGRQHDVRALNPPEFIEDRAGTPAEPRAVLPLFERLPQHVGDPAVAPFTYSTAKVG